MAKWSGCQPRDAAIKHAKQEIEKSEDSPIAHYERELEQNYLKTRYYEAVKEYPDVLRFDNPV